MCFQSCVSSCGSLILLDGAGASLVSIFLAVSLSFGRKGHLLKFLTSVMTSVSWTPLTIFKSGAKCLSFEMTVSCMMALESVIQCLVPFLDIPHQLVFNTVFFNPFFKNMTVFAFIIPCSLFWLKISIRLWTLMGNYLVSYMVPTGNWYINLKLLFKYYFTVFFKGDQSSPPSLEYILKGCPGFANLLMCYTLNISYHRCRKQRVSSSSAGITELCPQVPQHRSCCLCTALCEHRAWQGLRGCLLTLHSSSVHLTHNGSCL